MQEPPNTSLTTTNLSFESLKKLNEHGVEYWSARDLQPCLGYSQWRYFENAVTKAIESCKQSGNDPAHHFAGARKPIPGGKGSFQVVEDYHLSRFACYPITQNGDPRKPEIAHAQKYFAIQTRRQEISEEKLKRENIKNQRDAMVTHELVGKKVRSAIEEIGGTLPENTPPVEHIKTVKTRLKKNKPKLILDDKDHGLLSQNPPQQDS